MKIAVTGASGLVGKALVDSLLKRGDSVFPVVRRRPKDETEIRWSPDRGEIDAQRFEGLNAVVHLAGENIAGGRWSVDRKRRIRESRVQGTTLLAETLAGLKHPPRALICASAMGFFGANRGDEVLAEDSPPGEDFFASVCGAWESSADAARAEGIRVVHLRFGLVLSPKGGALKLMLPPFKLGVGGVVGTGEQWMSWLHLADAVGMIEHALDDELLRGPTNAVTPNPVTNRDFTKTLGSVLRRPTLIPLPAAVVKLVFGEMGEATILGSLRLRADQLEQSGYKFRFPKLEPALRDLLR